MERLFARAASNLSSPNIRSSLAQGKAFELYALIGVLRLMRKSGYTVMACSPSGARLTFPGGPSAADKRVHSYFSMFAAGQPQLEAWVSIETTTLSAMLFGGSAPVRRVGSAFYHELDVAVFDPLPNTRGRADYEKVRFAASCKDSPVTKAHVREALGLRRETAFLQWHPRPSLCPWFVTAVPATPASAMVLFARGPNCRQYAQPVDQMGLYVRQLSFW